MNRKPTHPGAFLKHRILFERGVSVTAAARLLGVSRKALGEFLNEKSKCSRVMARRLAESTGANVAFWMNMQAKLDIWEALSMDKPQNITAFPRGKS